MITWNENAFSNECVPCQRPINVLVGTRMILAICSSIPSVTLHREPGGFFGCQYMYHVLCPSMSYTCPMGDMSYVCVGLVLALVLAQERHDNRPQHLIHVQVTDQVSIYNHQDLSPLVFNISPRICRTLMHDPYIEILRKMAWRPVNFDIDLLSCYRCYKIK